MQQIREHLIVLASYEVLDLNTADVLENYIGDFIDQIDINPEPVAINDGIWDSIKNETKKNRD